MQTVRLDAEGWRQRIAETITSLRGPAEYWDDLDVKFVSYVYGLDPDRSEEQLAKLVERELGQRRERGEPISETLTSVLASLNDIADRKRTQKRRSYFYPRFEIDVEAINNTSRRAGIEPLNTGQVCRLILMLIGTEDDWDEASLKEVLEIYGINARQSRKRLVAAVDRRIDRYHQERRPVPTGLLKVLALLEAKAQGTLAA